MEPGGVYVSVYEPIRQGTRFLFNAEQPDRYQHVIQAVGGYWSATFTVGGNLNTMEDWIQNGLARHIVTHDEAMDVVWEGFVNEISINYGPLTVMVGPLLDVANWVDLVYSTMDLYIYSVGMRERTGYVEDTDSQAWWGILPKVLSTGGVSVEEAAQIRDTYLEEHRAPTTTKRWKSQEGGALSVTVNCLGYVHWLHYPYNNISFAHWYPASEKIDDVLLANPNISWLPFGTAHLDTNNLLVRRYEDDDNLAWSVIKDTVARGDIYNGRWLCGVYADRELWYQAATADVYYFQELSDPMQRIIARGGGEVRRFNVLPGRWLLFSDFLTGAIHPTDLKDDARAMFIETVTFDAPDTLQLEGGKFDRLPQALAQLGISGIGA